MTATIDVLAEQTKRKGRFRISKQLRSPLAIAGAIIVIAWILVAILTCTWRSRPRTT